MIHTIREAFNELLAENVWMDDETRAVAKEKADAMNERIGYPELLTNSEELSKEYINVRGLDRLRRQIHCYLIFFSFSAKRHRRSISRQHSQCSEI